MKNPDPLEKDIEKKVCDYAKSLGCLCYKFTSPSRRSVPDRLFIAPGGKAFFIEFKRLGGHPTESQTVEINKMLMKGAKVYIVDTVNNGKKWVDHVLQRSVLEMTDF